MKTHFVYIIFEGPFKFSDTCLSFRAELMDEFIKMSRPFKDHHQELFAFVKSVFLELFFKEILGFYKITKLRKSKVG